MTPEQTQKLWTELSVMFPGQLTRLTEDQQRAMAAGYRRFLADLDYPSACTAVEQLIATSEFLPTVAKIRAAVVELELGPQRSGGEAWSGVLREVGRTGVCRQPTFEDPVTAQAVRGLGWQAICNSENQVADRARFIELYDQLAARVRRTEVTANLPATRRFAELKSAETSSLPPDAPELPPRDVSGLTAGTEPEYLKTVPDEVRAFYLRTVQP